MHNAMRVREGTVTLMGSHPHSRWSFWAQGRSMLSHYQASYPALWEMATSVSLNTLLGPTKEVAIAMHARLFSFVGGVTGPWRVVHIGTIVGEPLAQVRRLDIVTGAVSDVPDGAQWVLRGLTSNERYVTRTEQDHLVAQQPTLGRAHASCAALIPIRKTASWWGLAQDKRRRIFEESSRHVATGLRYLPAVARRLHHCRDLGENEPFDFLTWFEYGPSDSSAFGELVAELRASEEWRYVDREIDIRVVRDEA